MIKVDNLTIMAANRILCSGVSFELKKEEKAALTGASGCGKSSLLRAIAGLHDINAGIIKIDGVELTLLTLGAIRQRIVFLPQQPVMGAESTRDALLLPFAFKLNAQLRPDHETILKTLALIGLPEEILKQPAALLSGGEKQRIAIARGLLMKRNIFLADEITASLDGDSRDQVIRILQELPITMLAVSHDPVFLVACPIQYHMENNSVRKVRP
ncbi:MAG: ATP-binding cassette domain-containing protein [Victivallaceae bacterium]|nr:ATP-binding cassette domain-containing protein [Victivallaceae bacterium]MDD3703110.1 ATP-binding cassette domain-containing protein [Victivallaceae bacterium]